MRALRCPSRAPPSSLRPIPSLSRTLLTAPRPAPLLSTPIRPYGSTPLADHLKFVESVRERRITPSPGEVRRRLQDLVRKRRPEESEQLVDTLRQSGGRVFVEYMNEVINAHVTAGQVDRALQIFENLSTLHLEADIATYTILITGLIKHKMPQRADTLMEEMRHRRVHPDGIFFSKVLSALCANNDLARVVKLLDAVKATPIIPSHISLCSAIQLFQTEGAYPRLIELVDIMHKHYAPTPFTASSKMTALVRTGRPDEAKQLWDSLPPMRVKPNTLMYNLIIQVARNTGRTDQAVQLYEDMQRNGCLPDAYTISLLLHIHAQERQQDKVQQLLDMPARSKNPSHEMRMRYHSVVAGAARGHDLDTMERAAAKLRTMGPLDRYVIYALIVEYAFQRNREPAEKLFREHGSVRSDVTLLNAMLYLYNSLGLVPEAEKLFMSMPKNQTSFSQMVDLYERTGKLEEAKRTREAYAAAYPRQALQRPKSMEGLQEEAGNFGREI